MWERSLQKEIRSSALFYFLTTSLAARAGKLLSLFFRTAATGFAGETIPRFSLIFSVTLAFPVKPV